MATDSPKLLPENVQVLAEHYQKTFELADGLRKDRNKFFIFLVAFLAGAALLFGLGKAMALKLLAVWISKNIGLLDANPSNIPGLSQKDVTDWLLNANFDLLLTLTLAVVFYLMMNLYHHTETVSRLYIYLGKLEKEIRRKFEPNSKMVSFSREGDFYDEYNSQWLKSIGLAYSIVLTILLAGFLFLVGQDILVNLNLSDIPLFLLKVAEIIIGVAIIAYLYAYWKVSVKGSQPSEKQKSK